MNRPSLNANQARALLLTTLCMFSLVGCGPDREERKLESELRTLQRDRARLQSELSTYRAIIAGETKQSPLALATVGIADLERALRSGFPISFSASKLSKQVSGTVNITKLSRASLRNGVVKFQLEGRGRNIKLRTAVPPGYQKMARELVAGLQAGVTLDVEGQVYVKKGTMYFDGTTRRAKLRKHAKKTYHDLIVNGVNAQLFRKPHPIKFDALRIARKSMRLKGMLTETNRFVFVFK